METEYHMGIDPSIHSTGWAIMNSKKELIDYGKIVSESDTPTHKIIQTQYDVLVSLLQKYNIIHILCEDQFAQKNIDTLKKLSQNRGAIMLMAAQHHIPIQVMAPSSWRKICLGNGKATKKDCVIAMNELYGLKLKMVQNDIAEAIAICRTSIILSEQSA